MCRCVQEEEGTRFLTAVLTKPNAQAKQQARDTVTPEKKALIQREQKKHHGKPGDNTQGGKQIT